MNKPGAMRPALRRYVAAVTASGAVTLVVLVATAAAQRSFPTPADATVFLAAIVGSQIPLVIVRRRSGQDEASVADVFAFASVLLFSPAFGCVAMSVGSVVADLRRRKAPYRIAFNVAQHTLSIAAAGLVVSLADARMGGDVGLRELGVAALAAATFFAVNWVLVGVAVALLQRSRVVDFLVTDLGVGFLHSSATLTQGALAAIVYPHAPWALPFFLPAAYTTQVAARRYQALRHQARETMETLAGVLDERDPATHNHSRRVSRYATMVALEMGLPEREVEEIEKAGLVHDLGKVAIPDSVLLKPGALTPAEFHQMHSHPGIGADILGTLEIYASVKRLVRHHHERWDGKGYPDGLAGERIPLGSRIICVVDAFDAMTSRRPYRSPVSKLDALEELSRGSGTQFDPEIVAIFTRLVGQNPELFSPAEDDADADIVSIASARPRA